jgi:hypothetical protein
MLRERAKLIDYIYTLAKRVFSTRTNARGKKAHNRPKWRKNKTPTSVECTTKEKKE